MKHAKFKKHSMQISRDSMKIDRIFEIIANIMRLFIKTKQRYVFLYFWKHLAIISDLVNAAKEAVTLVPECGKWLSLE